MYVLRYCCDIPLDFAYFQNGDSANPDKWTRDINMAETFVSIDAATDAYNAAIKISEDYIPAGNVRFKQVFIAEAQIIVIDPATKVWPVNARLIEDLTARVMASPNIVV